MNISSISTPTAVLENGRNSTRTCEASSCASRIAFDFGLLPLARQLQPTQWSTLYDLLRQSHGRCNERYLLASYPASRTLGADYAPLGSNGREKHLIMFQATSQDQSKSAFPRFLFSQKAQEMSGHIRSLMLSSTIRD